MALLEIQSVTQIFGGLCALSDFNLRFEGGELNGLIGPNGAGKTTVFNLVSGFYKPSQGNILFKGTDTRRLKPHKITPRPRRHRLYLPDHRDLPAPDRAGQHPSGPAPDPGL